VVAVSRAAEHRFSKVPVDSITLVAGIGVLGDAHAGALVQHRSRVRRDPTQPNLRQVHLIHAELFEIAAAQGYDLGPGDLGENILTAGLDLHALPADARLRFGDAVVRVTGQRNPCAQINDFRPGLLKLVLARSDGTPHDQPAPSTSTAEAFTTDLVRRAGIMGVVEVGGIVRPGQTVEIELPEPPHRPLGPV